MAHNIWAQNVFDVLFAPEDAVKIFRRILPTGLTDNESLICNVENALLEA